ncbi:MAG: DUF2768 family protein [Lewinella sp.]
MSAIETTLDPRMEAVTRRSKLHPLKMLMYIGLGSLVMMFIALTSAYIVRRASGNWLEFSIPTIFYVNTLVIVVSSLTLHAAYQAFKREAMGVYKGLLTVSFLLGIAFVVLQFVGWQDLAAQGVPLKINPSGDFIYAISWLHAVHVVGGLAALFVTLLVAYIRRIRNTPARKLRLELTMIYWHFVDVLWIYLIIFLSLQR